MPEYDTDKRPPRTRAYGVLLAAVVAVGSLILVAGKTEPKSAVSSPAPPKAIAVPEMAGTKSEVEIFFRGKSFCVVKRKVPFRFGGEVTEVNVENGQNVQKDDVLATYKLDRDSVMHVERVLFPEAVRNLQKALEDQQMDLDKLNKVTMPIKQSELEKIEKELSNMRELNSRQMASNEALSYKEREFEDAKKRHYELVRHIEQVKATIEKTRGDLAFHQDRQKRDIDLLEWQTGRSYADGSKPRNVAHLRAPISGQVIWIHPDLADKAELPRGFDALMVAAISPMVVRCKVHELDLVRLKTGDRGTVSFDAMPEKKVGCKITRIPWISRNPALDVPADYEIEATLENPDETIKDGLTCNVKIHVAR